MRRNVNANPVFAFDGKVSCLSWVMGCFRQLTP